MTIPATISLTESQCFTALGNFIASVTGLPSGHVLQGQQNRAAEPAATDFVIMTALRQERLETNEVAFFDNIFTGTIAGTTLTVSSVAQSEGGLQPGTLLIDIGWPTMNIAPNTTIVAQLTGAPGGTGTYRVSVSQTLAGETLYAGLETDLAQTKWTAQLDIHGPNAGNNAKIIETMFRSEFGVNAFIASGFDVTPLYCDEARQMGFINGENQWENRYTMDACLQVNPIVGVPAQFFDQAKVTTIEVLAAYGP